MEADTDIYSEVLAELPEICQRGRSDNMSKGVKTMMVTPTETADLS